MRYGIRHIGFLFLFALVAMLSMAVPIIGLWVMAHMALKYW